MNCIPMNRFARLLLLGLATAFVATAQAQNVTNLFPNGDFVAGGPSADWLEVNGDGVFSYSYPATGGNPNEYGVIDNTGGGGWGIWVGGATDPGLPLSSLGLVPGGTYTFVQDMMTLAGTNTGGLKIESWGPTAMIHSSGDMRPTTWSTTGWSTYTFNYTIAFGAVAIKVVPLWGQNSAVGFDNLGVVVPLSSPLSAEIINPASGATVGTNFLIVANASVVPGSVTSVDFYLNNALLGNDDAAPFSWNVVGATPGAAALQVVAHDDGGSSVTSAPVNVTIQITIPESAFVVDPASPWQSYMNVYQTPQNFGAWVFGSPWGANDLIAQFSGSGPASVLTLRPNRMPDTNVFWYDYSVEPLLSDPTNFAAGAIAFKEMEANYYVQLPDGTVNGNVVKFSGVCKTNTLDIRLNPGVTNGIGNGWTNYAFVKDFAADYSSSVDSLVILTSGAPFSVSLETSPDPSRHIQYGFITRGPNVHPSDTNTYGMVQIQSLDANPTNVTVNSSANWIGYMNVFNKPQDGGAYQFGSGWGTADLNAGFTPLGLKLSPNTIGDPDPYWYTPSGGPGAVGNKTMDASMYVEIGSLPGRKLIFSGTVLSNTLVSATNTNAIGNGWTSVAFIKDFAPDYSTFNSVTVPLTNGNFSIQLTTVNDPARHVQYGFETIGPNVWVTDAAQFGSVLIANVGVLPTSITPSRSGGNLNLTFPTQTGKTYTVQYKNLLTDAGWNTLTTTNGTGANAVISDPASGSQRYYRLSVQ
ncbi:MAG TPA: Ig-like domain-containing protein [Verrucomicrobiae bacterium]|nr:Ig-like domain-containing protein [Verrucomicrobiae bacterium]